MAPPTSNAGWFRPGDDPRRIAGYFKPGFDPRRHQFTRAERQKGGLKTVTRMLHDTYRLLHGLPEPRR